MSSSEIDGKFHNRNATQRNASIGFLFGFGLFAQVLFLVCLFVEVFVLFV